MVRFDKPCLKVSGAVEYFRENMVGDYLTEGGRAEMTWQGAGAERLGLSGVCQLADFEALCRGRHPGSKARLMVRDKGAQRRVFFFGQISAPKDVSVAYVVGVLPHVRILPDAPPTILPGDGGWESCNAVTRQGRFRGHVRMAYRRKRPSRPLQSGKISGEVTPAGR